MNDMIPLLSLLVVLVQLSDAYLRYLAFQGRMSPEEKTSCRKRFLLWGLCSLPAYAFLLQTLETVFAYKLLLMTGWIPYLAIFMRTLPHMTRPHIYVFGMSAVWSVMQHNWSSILLAAFLSEGSRTLILLVHAALYLLWFLLLLPLERRVFSRLLPSPEMFEETPLGNILSLFPLLLTMPPLILLADAELWHSWEERLSRLYLPLLFFLLYRYSLSAARSFKEFSMMKRQSLLLKEEISSLREDRAMRERDVTLLNRFKEEVAKDCQALEALLAEGKSREAMALVEQKERGLHALSVKKISDAPLVNAAISLYLDRAQELDIPFRYKVNLPEKPAVEESDLAVLISNLLENAVTAADREDAGKRSVSLKIQHEGKKCVLSVENTCTKALRLGEDGLPRTEMRGHGTGMVSLRMFLEKYRGYAAFTQEGGRVRLLMYWRDEASC